MLKAYQLWLFCLCVFISTLDVADAFSTAFRSAIEHLGATPPLQSVADLANVQYQRRDGGELLAYKADGNDNVLLLIHEFFGLSQNICDMADALSADLGCTVICPDTFRGESSTFIPKCIWLALSTPQDRVNQDLQDVLRNINPKKLAVMGFCYGGGKAIRFTTQQQPTAATIVCYGSPLTDVTELSKLQAPVCGVFGEDDIQFPKKQLDTFQSALKEAKVESNVQIYPNVGHAFLTIDKVRQGQQPQVEAYNQVSTFLKNYYQ